MIIKTEGIVINYIKYIGVIYNNKNINRGVWISIFLA